MSVKGFFLHICNIQCSVYKQFIIHLILTSASSTWDTRNPQGGLGIIKKVCQSKEETSRGHHKGMRGFFYQHPLTYRWNWFISWSNRRVNNKMDDYNTVAQINYVWLLSVRSTWMMSESQTVCKSFLTPNLFYFSSSLLIQWNTSRLFRSLGWKMSRSFSKYLSNTAALLQVLLLLRYQFEPEKSICPSTCSLLLTEFITFWGLSCYSVTHWCFNISAVKSVAFVCLFVSSLVSTVFKMSYWTFGWW